MEIEKRVESGVVIMKIDSSIIMLEPALVGAAISQAVNEGRKNIILDIEAMSYVDSLGIGILVRALTSAQKSGGALKLACVPKNVQRVLAMSGLDEVFESHETLDSAIRAFGS